MFISLPFMPESPTWLVNKGRKEKASQSLRKIHKTNPSYNPTSDLALLEVQKHQESLNMEGSTWISLITDPIERRKTLYSCGAMFAQQINGILFFYNYGVIFAEAIGMSDPFTISLITNILQIFAVGAAVLLGNKVRRRSNLLVTTGMMFFAFIVIGKSIRRISTDRGLTISTGGIGTKTIDKASKYVIVVFSYVIIVAFNFGLGPLAYTVAREMAIGRNQNKIMSASIIVFFITTWAVSFTAPYLYYSANLGPMLGFIYAGTTLISLLYIWFCVGETTGRSNAEIAALFARGIPVRQWRHTSLPEVREEFEEKIGHNESSENEKSAEKAMSISHSESV